MSEFSVLLGNMLKNSGLSVYSLAKDIQCGRTWLQKIVSGERHIDLKNYLTLQNILVNHVDGSSLTYLYEGFALDYFGQKEYHIISYIKRRLLEMRELSDYINKNQGKEFQVGEYLIDYSSSPIENNERIMVSNICDILLKELKQAQKCGNIPRLYVKIPSNWKHVKNMILIIMEKMKIHNNDGFKYIVSSKFEKEAELSQIENFLTAIEFASYGYNVYKSELSSDVQIMNDTIFPYYIITGSRITLITDDGKAFIESEDEELIRKISSKFEEIVSGRERFLLNINANIYNSMILDRKINEMDDFFEISNGINVSKFYTKEIMKEIMPAEFDDRELLIETLNMFYRKIRESKSSMFFNIDSIRHFMESDETQREGGFFNLNFTHEIKLNILKDILEYYKNGDGEIRMLKNNKFLTHDDIYIFGWAEKIICTTDYLYADGNQVNAMAVVNSPSIAKHMYNYSKYIMNSDNCLNKEASLVVLKNIIRAYELDE